MKKVLPPNSIIIPDNAKKVFAGEIFDVYQWPQKMYDGSSKTFEMLRRPDTVQVVIVKDDKLILINNEQPGRGKHITFVGGRADEDDSWITAAQRETKEETGMTFKNWKLVYVEQPIPKAEWFVPWFVASEIENEGSQNLDSGERISLLPMSFEEVREMIFESNESTLKYALNLFTGINGIDELISLPEFQGQEVDR